MRISDILGTSLANLWKRKMRTVLTVLGVVIGTASIVVMLSLGLGLKEARMAQVGSAGGLTEIMVYSDAMYGSSDLLLDDQTAEKFAAMDFVESVQPLLYYSMPFQMGKYEGYMDLIGVTPEYMSQIELGEGEYPQKGTNMSIIVGGQLVWNMVDMNTGDWLDFESESMPEIDFMGSLMIGGIEVEEVYTEDTTSTDSSGVVDSEFAVTDDFSIEDEFAADEEGFDEGGEDDSSAGDDGFDMSFEDDMYEEMDESFSYFTSDMKRVNLNVSGVVAGGVDSYSEYSYYCYTDLDILKEFLKKNYNANAIIPGQPTDRNGKPYKDLKYSQFVVKVDEAENVETVLGQIQSMGYQAEANKEWLEEIEKEFMLIEAVLGGIGAVAMLVAAISIANTMTMSIYERTKEIGVMKVLGCGLGNIRSMFLAEAAFIGFLGGVIGLMLSYLISFLLNQFVAPYFMSDYGSNVNISTIPIWLVGASLLFSTLVGMIAGFFPAQRATRLSPLAAIRNE